MSSLSARRAERGVQWLSVAAVWLVFFLARAAAARHAIEWEAQRLALPVLTSGWLGMAGSAASFLLPLLCTFAVVAMVRKGSVHANWAAGAILVLSLLYVLLAQAAIALPSLGACGCVK